MDEMTHQSNQPKGGSKKLITIIIVALLLVGGGVAAYVLLDKSPKEQYFLAEKNSIDILIDGFKDKYEPELTFAEDSQKKPTESNFELSADFTDPTYGMLLKPEDEELINNSIVKIKTANDYQKKIATADLSLDLAGMFEVKGLQIGINKHELTVQLPGTKDTILIKDKDIPDLLREIDPNDFEDLEAIDFEKLFEQTEFLTEKDREYLQKEYLGMIYDELPEDSFTSEKEDVKIDGKTVSAEKVKMKLSQKQVKDILYKVFDKAQNDKKLKAMIKEQLEVQQFGGVITAPSLGGADQEFDSVIKDFENSMKEAKEDIKEAKIPSGISSTIWVDKDLIVKREFGIKVIDNTDEEYKLTVKGTQLLTEENKKMDYAIRMKDDSNDNTLNLKVDSTYKDGKGKDSIVFDAVDGTVEYTNEDTLKDGKRTFDRAFALKDDSGELFSLNWSGDAKYTKSKKNVNHEFSVDIPELGSDFLTLKLKDDSEHVKSIKAPTKKNVKDIGKMTEEELMDYFQNELAPDVLSQFGAF